MAEEQVGTRKDHPRELPSWMKLFTAFKVALDPKKLLLAAAGILTMAFGWWLLAAIFFLFNSRPEPAPPVSELDQLTKEKFDDLKISRTRWNLLYEMAGPTPASVADAYPYDALDLSNTLQEYRQLISAVADIEKKTGKRLQKVTLGHKPNWTNYWLEVHEPKKTEQSGDRPESKTPQPTVLDIDAKATKAEDLEALKERFKRPVSAGDIKVDLPEAKTASIGGAKVVASDPKTWLDFYNKNLGTTVPLSVIEEQIKEKSPKDRDIYLRALRLVDQSQMRYKPAGKLRTWPWFEDRGPNPYRLVTANVKNETAEGTRYVPWERGQFPAWVMNDQVPVMLEPLVKFLSPILYLFNPGSGGLNRWYLFLVILWTVFTWALFGGAITRMAAVQVARPTEKVGMTEAVQFAWSRYKSFVSAPLFPLIFIVVLTVFLIFFGFFQEFTWFFGDIVVAGLFWPLVLLVGLIMAVVLVGLIGWPLMYSTISAEGSDSFDAISRSYSYVYQAPWNYLWYAFVAVLYGAVLVFFVGFMGSLMVYMGKWGVSQTPGPASREPTYLFIHAPTSFGWRDLLLQGGPAEPVEVVRPNGTVGTTLQLTQDYMETMSWSNYVGAFLVSVWIYIVFLMVVGFGYSYFWTASTIIYLLMRNKVDDTEMDEVHLEEEEFEEPAPKVATVPAAPAATPAPAGVGAGVGAQRVESPTFRVPAPPPPNVTAPPVVVTPPSPAPPPMPAPKTQLAQEPPAAPKTQLAPPEPLAETKESAAAPPAGNGEGKSASSETGGSSPRDEHEADEGKH